MKKTKKMIFLQDCGIFSNQVVVSVGGKKEDALKFVKDKKNFIQKECIEWVESLEIWDLLEFNEAVVAYQKGRIFLLLKDKKNDWDYWETLVHELYHIVEHIAEEKKFQQEQEAKAYLQGYLFQQIRRKIMGII